MRLPTDMLWTHLRLPQQAMNIEAIRPEVIGGKATLEDRLITEGKVHGLSEAEIMSIISAVPLKLYNSSCFLDLWSDFWRYEFGLPYLVKAIDKWIWGPHTWPRVDILFKVLLCAHLRLPKDKRQHYYERLAEPKLHWNALSEFLPAIRLPKDIKTDFEVPTGVGNRDIEWYIHHPNRPVLIEVKKRTLDFIDHMIKRELAPDKRLSPPAHDVSLMFKKVVEKYASSAPDHQLQGAWIAPTTKQAEDDLQLAFEQLDHSKIHFIILGDWQPGIKLLTRRQGDQQFILEIFQENLTDRFHFDREFDINFS